MCWSLKAAPLVWSSVRAHDFPGRVSLGLQTSLVWPALGTLNAEWPLPNTSTPLSA
jgi:hypothetical protein